MGANDRQIFKLEKLRPLSPEFFQSQKVQNIVADKQAGFYLIDKPKGVHSFSAVSALRRELKIKKVGFAGTLDPLASGLLILATGRATRLLDYFHYLPKTYEADILFGQTSDSYDLEGKIVINESAKEFFQAELEKNLSKFLGEQTQVAPIYSAKKIAGQKLHELSRRGQAVQAPSTHIAIYSLDISQFNWPHAELIVTCSAGTYIRSLAHDFGQIMGTGALLAGLRRTKIGDFSVKNALALAKVDQANLVQYRLEPKAVLDSLARSLQYGFSAAKDLDDSI